jgi:hypothetical protein
VPAIAHVMCEEAPGVVIVLVGEDDAHAVIILGTRIGVVSPDEAEIEGASGGHDGDVWQGPAAVVVGERFDRLQEKGMAGDGAHDIIGDSRGQSAADPGGVGEKGVEAAVASVVQVDVDAAKVVQHKVSDRVGALDGVRVAIERLEEPRVLAGNKLA